MSGFIYSIVFKLGGESAVDRAIRQTSRLDRNMEKVTRSNNTASDSMDRFVNSGKGVGGVERSVQRLITRIGGLYAAWDTLNKAAQDDALRRSVDFATSGQGVQNLGFLNKTVDELGLVLPKAQQGFKLLAGSTKGTVLEGQATRDIFLAVSKASTVMGLSAANQEGAFNALAQMASKGNVQAEELRGQLGERLPGAFNIAARAMGVTTKQLNKMLDNGEVLAEDFLPKFAAELNNTFEGSVASASQSAVANFGRFETAVYRLQVRFGQQLLPTVTSFLTNYLIPGIDFLSQHIDLVMGFGLAFGAAYAAVKIYNTTVMIATGMTKMFAGAMRIVNLVMRLNPIGLVVTALFALGGAVVWAWNKFAGFRGFVMGLWETIKELGRIMWENAIKPFEALGKVIVGVFTFDKDLILSGIKQGVDFATKDAMKAGGRLASAWNTGYEKGLDSFANNPKVPGSSQTDAVSSQFSNLKDTSGDKKKDDKKIRDGIEGITGGGTRSKNVTINFQKFFDQIVIESQQVTEGADEVAEIVMRKLLGVLNSANQVQ